MNLTAHSYKAPHSKKLFGYPYVEYPIANTYEVYPMANSHNYQSSVWSEPYGTQEKLYVTHTVPNQNYPQGVFNPVYACFTVVEDTRCILRMHNERIYSVTLAIHNSCITHDAHREFTFCIHLLYTTIV